MQADEELTTNDLREALMAAQKEYEGGNFAVAEITFKRALQELPDDATTSSNCLKNLIAINNDRGDLNESIRLALRLVSVARESQGEDSEAIVNAMVELAKLYEHAGRYEESGDLYYRAKVISEKLVWAEGKDDKPNEDESSPDPAEAAPRKHAFQALKDNVKAKTEERETPAQQPQELGTVVVESKIEFRPEVEDATAKTSNIHMRHTADRARHTTAGTTREAKKTEEDETPHRFREEEHAEKQSDHSRKRKSDDDLIEEEQPVRKERLSREDTNIHFRPNPESSGPSHKQAVGTSGRSEIDVKASTHKLRVVEVKPSFDNAFTVFARAMGQMGSALNLKQMLWSVGQGKKNSEKVNLKGTLSGAIFVALIAAVVAFMQPRQQQLIDVYLSMPHNFVSVDGDMSLNWKAGHDSVVTIGEQTYDVETFIYGGEFKDDVVMTLRSFIQRPIYLFHRPIGLVDEQGGVLYASNGAVATLADEIRDLAERVDKFYQSKKHYPVDAGDLGGVQAAAYDNPLTDQADQTLPRFEQMTLGASDTLEAAHAKIQDLYADMGKQGRWIGDQPLSAGIINCCAITAPYGDKTLQVFVMQAGGKSNRALRSGHPGEFYFVASEDGRQVDVGTPYNIQSSSQALRPGMIWIIQPGGSAELLLLLRHGNALIFGFVSLICMILLLCKFDKRKKFMIGLALLAALSIAAGYALESHLP
ncbi:MAG TPA: tetratricopeptide repeat protein [Planktothrix sp.]|jgi:tetratricopeptide (TPR) repeat protein